MDAAESKHGSEQSDAAPGFSVPCPGLGTWQMKPAQARDAVRAALACGIRHIDTAKYYGNEEAVGEAVRASGIQRSDVFICTKLWHTSHGSKRAPAAIRQSCERLNLGYIDLYLIHWPDDDDRVGLQTWRCMEDAVAAGTLKHIGVSNYSETQLAYLLKRARIRPLVNQIEFNPAVFTTQTQGLLQYCNQSRVSVVGYSPFAQGDLLSDEVVLRISKQCQRTPAQVLLRWCVQHGVVVIPKSSRRKRIESNIQGLFEWSLSEQHMLQLDGLHVNYPPSDSSDSSSDSSDSSSSEES